MLLPSDIKALLPRNGVLDRIVAGILLSAPFALIVLAYANLYHAVSLAAGSSHGGFVRLVDVWRNGLALNEEYSGEFVMALDMFRTAVTQILAACLTTAIVWAHHAAMRRNARILETLRGCGALDCVGGGQAQVRSE